MKCTILLCGALALASVMPATCLPSGKAERTADVLVYGGMPAGIAAALAAADAGVDNVVIICEEKYIGGMMTLGGLGFRDHMIAELLTGTMTEWLQLNSEHFKVSYPVYQPGFNVGLANLMTMIDRRNGKIQIITEESLVEGAGNVEMDDTQIVSINTESLTQPSRVTTWRARVFIDATYTGDLMRASGASWTYGREPISQYNESLAGVQNPSTVDGNFQFPVVATKLIDTKPKLAQLVPLVDPGESLNEVGEGDDRVMGYSYRICITQNKENQVPIPKPDNYDPDHWEILRRFYAELLSHSGSIHPPFSALSYYNYPPGDKFDVCDSGELSPVTTDAANLGQGYPNGTRAERKIIAKKHEDYVKGLFHFLLTDDLVPENVRNSAMGWGLCKDEWVEYNNWSPMLYVREAGRLVGDKVFTQNDRISSSILQRIDSIAVADWSIDIHIMSRTASKTLVNGSYIALNEGQTLFTGIYQKEHVDIPFYVMVPKKSEVTNLLVPTCPSVSHVVFGAMREEPFLWQLGRAAGVAAALLASSKSQSLAVHDLNVVDIQDKLIQQKAILHGPQHYTPTPPPPRWGGNNKTLTWMATVNMTDISDSPKSPNWTFIYYYDWTTKASRYDHQAGQHDEVCKGVRGMEDNGQPCQVMNTPEGKLYLVFPMQDFCCLCGKSITIRSDWLQTNQTSYQGLSTINGVRVNQWLVFANSDNHYYATDDDEKRPVRFMEHNHGALKQWDFIEYQTATPAELRHLLEAPVGCEDSCESDNCKALRKP